MSSENFVPTELHARASVDLQQEVQDELVKPDPSPEAATAALRKAIEDNNQDESTGED